MNPTALMSVALAGLLAAGCGSKKRAAEPGACRAACEHMIELGMADLEKSGRMMGADGAEILAKLKATAAASRDSDLATCQAQCRAGKLDTACTLQAKSIDGAMSCTSASGNAGNGARTPVEPPSTRVDEDWPKAPLRDVTDEVGGVRFSVKLPAELQEQEADHTDDQRGWDFPGYPFSQPRFRVSLTESFPKTEAEALEHYDVDDKDEVILRKEHRGDRFVLLYQSKTYIVAYVAISAGDRGLECYGTHSGSELTRPDVIGPWLVDVCSTLAVRR